MAFIGCGGVASGQHAPAYGKLPDVEIAAACDVVAEKAQAFTGTFGGRAYTDYRQMLGDVRPDVVDVCTREHQHVEPAIAALEAGANVLCEKIMAHTMAGGRAMVAAAERAGSFLGVDYNYRFMPVFARMKAMIDSGEIGELALLNAYCHAYCFHHAIDLVRWLGGATAAGGAGGGPDRSADGDGGTGNGSGDETGTRSANPVVAVGGQYTATEDPRYHFQVQCPDFVYVPSRNAALTLRFASGALASVTASRFEDLRANMLRVDVAGERGRLTADGITIDNLMGRLTHVPLVPMAAVAAPGQPAGQAARPRPAEIAYYDGDDRGFNVAFERSIAAFVARVRGEDTPDAAVAATGQDGLAVLEIERALVLSQAQDRTIALPPVD